MSPFWLLVSATAGVAQGLQHEVEVGVVEAGDRVAEIDRVGAVGQAGGDAHALAHLRVADLAAALPGTGHGRGQGRRQGRRQGGVKGT